MRPLAKRRCLHVRIDSLRRHRPNVGVRIDGATALVHAEVQMWSGELRVAGVTYCPEGIAGTHECPRSYQLILEVGVVQPHIARRIPYPHDFAAKSVLADLGHNAGTRCEDGGAAGREDVDPFMAAAACITRITIHA